MLRNASNTYRPLEPACGSLQTMAQFPSLDDLVDLLRTSKKEKNVDMAMRLSLYVCSIGLETNDSIGNYIIPLFVDCGCLSFAQSFFNKLPHRNEYCWTSLLHGYVDHGTTELGIMIYQLMQSEGVLPSRYTFIGVIKACTDSYYITGVEVTHSAIIENGFESDSYVGNALIDAYCKCDALEQAIKVFKNLPLPDIISCNSLISGYVEHGHFHEGLDVFESMETRGLFPDSVTLLCSLRACTYICALESGFKLHMRVIKCGFEIYAFIGNSLLNMYIRCGATLEAHQTLSRLQSQDVVSWNTLIAGFTEQGLEEEALMAVNHMKTNNICADAATLVCILKACGSSDNINKGRETHSEIVKRGLENESIVGNSIVDMYTCVKLLEDSKKVFEELPFRDVVAWNSILSGLCECYSGEEILNCFEKMQSEGISPNTVTLCYMLRTIDRYNSQERGLWLHTDITRKGYDSINQVCNSLVCMYARCGLYMEANDILVHCGSKDRFGWNVLLMGYVEDGFAECALACWQQMLLVGIYPDSVSYVYVLNACKVLGVVEEGQKIHIDICKLGLDHDHFLVNSLMDLYFNFHYMSDAKAVFDKIVYYDAVIWNTLIAGYAENGFGEEALNFWYRMQESNLSPIASTFTCILRVCGCMRLFQNVQQLHLCIIKGGYDKDFSVAYNMVSAYARCAAPSEGDYILNTVINAEFGFAVSVVNSNQEFFEETLDYLCETRLDVAAYVCHLKSYSNFELLDKGKSIHTDITKKGYEKSPVVHSAIIDMYGKSGLVAEAESVFHQLCERNQRSWIALISAYSSNGFTSDVFGSLDQMQMEGIHLTSTAYIFGLKACSNAHYLSAGIGIHLEITKRGFDKDLSVGNMLIYMYGKCSLLTESWDVFERLQIRDNVSWNTIISGYALNGLNEKVLECLELMFLEGFTVIDNVTIIYIIKACSYIGDIERGRQMHNDTIQYGLDDNLYISNAILDMYAKCGCFIETDCVFKVMSEHDIISWNVLIAALNSEGLSEEALNCLYEMTKEGVSPDDVTLACSLKTCCGNDSLPITYKLHSEIVKKGYDGDTFISNTLMDVYSVLNLHTNVGILFDSLETPDLVSWSTLLSLNAQQGLEDATFDCLKRMQKDGFSVDAITITAILKMCRNKQNINRAREVHVLIVTESLEQDPNVIDSLVHMYTSCNCLADSWGVFDDLLVRDAISWNILLGRCSERGYSEEVEKYFHQMQEEGISPDVNTWNSVLEAFNEQGKHHDVLKSVSRMQEQGLLPECLTYSNILRACGDAALIRSGKISHAVVQNFCYKDIALTVSVTDMYVKCGNIIEARCVFDAIPTQELISWNTLLTGYSHHGEVKEIFWLFEKMAKENINPDEVTVLNILTACSHSGLVDDGLQYIMLFNRVNETRVTIKHLSCLVDIFGRAGQIHKAVGMVETIPYHPDFMCWSALLGACWKHGDLGAGRHAFESAVELDGTHGGAFALMSRIYTDFRFAEDHGQHFNSL